MNSLASIALSGLNAAQTSLNAAAHNIANLPTEGFHRQKVQRSEQPGGGVSTQVQHASAVGAALEEDVVSQLQAKNAFVANLAVFKTSNQMTGVLLDQRA